MRGLIWEIEEKGILVYFDRENRVTEVKLDAESEAEVEAEKAEEEEHWDRIPMVLIEGVLYVDTGIGVMGDGFEVEDGEPVKALDGTVTSSEEGWEIPTENDQSNFGTGYGYLRGTEEGTVILFMNEKWFLFATEEKKQELLFPELMNQE